MTKTKLPGPENHCLFIQPIVDDHRTLDLRVETQRKTKPSLEFLFLLRQAMLEGKAIVGEADMLQAMQKCALRLAAKALDVFDATETMNIAHFIKKDFDEAYGHGWQCIVGTDFGSFVTHCRGCFIYFCVGSLAFLLFKVAVETHEEENLISEIAAVKI